MSALTRVKLFWAQVKDVVVYIVTPIAFALGYIYYLLGKNEQLESQLELSKALERQKELKNEQDEVDSEASNSFSDYDRVKREFLRSKLPGSDSES